mgnify:FL=1
MALIPLENTKKLMNTLNLKIAFVNEVSNDMKPSVMPSYSRSGDACIDLRSREDITLKSGCSALVHTGIMVSVPVGAVGLLYARSGNALKHGIGLANGVGVIDSNYRGEVGAILTNSSKDDFIIKVGDRIAQFMVIPLPTLNLVECSSLSTTNRGENGFGSSGK